MRRPIVFALLNACLLTPACSDGPPGKKLASGMARQLRVAPGAAAFLVDAVHPDDRSVPDDLLAGDLWLAALGESPSAQKVASGVPTSDGGFAFSRQGDALAWLAAYRFRAGLGELWIAAPGGAPQKISAEASGFAWSPAETAVAWVAPGRIGLLKAGFKETLSVPVEGAQAIAWAPDGKRLVARSSASVGGKLWSIDPASGAKREVAAATSDFAFAKDGALATLGPPPPRGGDRALFVEVPGKPPVQVARATAFAFSPAGSELALLSTDKQPGEATGELSRISREGGAGAALAQKVSDWRYTAEGDLLFLAAYDLRARAGTLMVAAPGATPRELGRKVQSFVAQGRRVLYLVQAPQKGDYKIELWTADLAGASPPRKIDEGVYGYELSPDGATLFWKARCAGGPRSCSLLRAPIDGSQPPLFLAPNVAGFDLSADGSRILIEQPHRGATRAVDLAAISSTGAPPKQVKPFALEVDASSRFADPSGKRAIFATVAAGKAGVYLADLP